MNKYNETNVIRSLSRKKGSLSINPNNKTIYVNKDSDDIGIKSWGKIDYLCNYLGYVYVFVKNASGFKTINNSEETINSKIAKREHKLNMAKMAKVAMKNKR